MSRWYYPVLFAIALSLALPVSAAPQHHKKTSQAPAKAAVQPLPVQAQATQPQAPPPPPPTPEEGPSSPAQVSFQGGKLTILARNSTMGDVLNEVRKKTGAAVDMPPVSSERVVGQFGPGAPRDVLAQLLNGSHYDYVLLGSPSDPGTLKKIVLMVRPTGPEPVPPPQNTPVANNNGEDLQQVPDVQEDQSSQDVAPDVQPESPPTMEQEEPQGEQQLQQPPNGGPMVKTPEQLLRELQQQQQQQQQQQNAQPQQ